MAKKNERKEIVNSAVLSKNEQCGLFYLGVRKVRTVKGSAERDISLDPSIYGNPRVANALADSWVTVSQNQSFSAAAIKRQAITLYLEYLDLRGYKNLSFESTPDQVCDALIDWSAGLEREYPNGSIMPYRLSSIIQQLLYSCLSLVQNDDGILWRIASGPSLIIKPAAREVDEFSKTELDQLVAAARSHLRIAKAATAWARGMIEDNVPNSLDPNVKELRRLLSLAYRFELKTQDTNGVDIKGVSALFPPEWRNLLSTNSLLSLCYQTVHSSVSALVSFRVLLMELTGLSSDEISSLKVSGCSFGDDGVTLHVDKARAGRSRTVFYKDERPNGRWGLTGVLKQLLLTMESLRANASPVLQDEVWLRLAYTRNKNVPDVTSVNVSFGALSARSWVDSMIRAGFTLNLSEPIDVRRIRKAKVSERAISLGARASDIAVDQHSIAVFDSYYATASSIQVYSARRVVEVQAKLTHGVKTGFKGLVEDREDVSAQALSEIADVTPNIAQAIKEGSHDMGVADCRDPFDSPFDSYGVLCHAAPLFCLGCRNGLVFPIHAPRIAYFLKSIRSAQYPEDPDDWIRTWGPQMAAAERVLSELGWTESDIEGCSVDGSDVLPSWLRASPNE